MDVCERCIRGWFDKPLIDKDQPFISHYRAECDMCKHIKHVMYQDDSKERIV
jgi:hypothetical protein